MKPIKVLFCHGGTLEKAGTEAYMMSVFNNVDPSVVHIDFLVFGTKEGYYDKHIITRGSKIFRIPLSIHELRHNSPSLKTLRSLIKAEQYDIVHSHMNALNPIIFNEAKRLGISNCVSHSHGSRHFVDNRFLIQMKERLKKKIPSYSNTLLACSRAAGDFLYGTHPYTILNNGIDLERYQFDEAIRETTRSMLNVASKTVYGHIGRFNFQKNHRFLIAVFAEIVSIDPHSLLVLVGEGELMETVKKDVNQRGLTDSVIFLGLRNDIPKLLQAMDVFLLPSVFEGLPYVLVEAQASGLQCFAADTIDKQSKLIDDFYFLALDDPKKWAQFVLRHSPLERLNTIESLREQGFDEQDNVHQLIEIYKKMVQ